MSLWSLLSLLSLSCFEEEEKCCFFAREEEEEEEGMDDDDDDCCCCSSTFKGTLRGNEEGPDEVLSHLEVDDEEMTFLMFLSLLLLLLIALLNRC